MNIGMLDRALDLAEIIANDMIGAAPPRESVYDCVQEQGYSSGVGQATTHLMDGRVGADYDSGLLHNDFVQAYDHCNVEQLLTRDEVNIPSLANPVLTFLETALTPNELNVGEREWFDSRSAFSSGFDQGYRETAAAAFDAQLSDRLSIDWGGAQNYTAPAVGGWGSEGGSSGNSGGSDSFGASSTSDVGSSSSSSSD